MTETHELMKKLSRFEANIGIVGLGYVGLPLAVSFAQKFTVVGFDICEKKILELQQGIDSTHEVDDLQLLKQKNISFTCDPKVLRSCEVIIVAVPTPVDKGNKPDLTALLGASKSIGSNLSNKKTYICFESTVYPGCTIEDCVPVIEKYSGKKLGQDFYMGYSPERINPGDKNHRFETIKKVVSGCCDNSANFFEQFYGSVVSAGVFKASSIAVAEAAKVIENTQRDINIALINELAIIFSRIGLDTREVLEAASTKWNFLKFFPGLVGGHCIGVDPYYLTYKAETLGYIPKVILSGRAVNDSMGAFVAQEVVKKTMSAPPKNGIKYQALILGFTFKENVPDIRNSKVIDLIEELNSFGFGTEIVDPIADISDAKHEYGVDINSSIPSSFEKYDAIIIAVAHEIFSKVANELAGGKLNKGRLVLADVKGILPDQKRNRLPVDIDYWRL